MSFIQFCRFDSAAALPSSEGALLGGVPGFWQLGDGVMVGVAGAVVCAKAVPASAKATGQIRVRLRR